MTDDLIKKLGESYVKKQCARCGSSDDVVFLFEGTIAREIDEDIIEKFKAKELFLNSKFYLCEKCASEFANSLARFLRTEDQLPHEETCRMFWREKPKGTGEAAVIIIPLDKRAKEAIEEHWEKLAQIFDATTDSEETIIFRILELDSINTYIPLSELLSRV